MRPATIVRGLRWLYTVMAVVAFGLAVAAALHGAYGTAVLNLVLTAVWVALFLRLRGR